MRRVPLQALGRMLSECLRLVSRGETVLITDAGRVVAELVPPRPGRAQTAPDAALSALVHDGLVQPALVAPGIRPRTPPRTERLHDVLRALEDDRSAE